MYNIDWSNETEVDALFRLGLVLINQPEEEFPVVEHDYSARYKRWERKFLADPFGYVKRKGRPIWLRTLRVAAAVILAVGITFGALVAVNPGVRAAVMRWFVERFQTHDSYRFTDTPGEREVGRWYPAYLPEGYVEMECLDLGGLIATTFENGEGNRIYFDYQPTTEGRAFQVNNEYKDVTNRAIGSCEGFVYQASVDELMNAVLWIDEEQGVSFRLLSFETGEVLVSIAKSVALNR